MHKRVTFNLNNADLNNITNDFSISLIDHSCNGGFLGEDARILSIKDNYFADVIGMNNSKVSQAPIGTGCMKINTLQGPIIGIFNQYATGGKGHTIHSALQMEAFGLTVEDQSRLLPGLNSKQAILTPDGYQIPLEIRGGLAYMDTSYPSDRDIAIFPHVFMTADNDWDPSIFDNHHDSPIQNEEEVIFNSEFLNSSKNQEIRILKSAWEFENMVLGDFINMMTLIFSVVLDMLI